MRHGISAVAAAVLGAMAMGSTEGEPAQVELSWKGPSQLRAGEGFLADIEVQNNGETAFTVESVELDGDLDRAFALVVALSNDAVDYGDGIKYQISPVTVAAGGTGTVQISGTAFLSGYRGGRVKVCDAGGQCFGGRIGATVQGGAKNAITAVWSVPSEGKVGEDFAITLSLKNESGGRDMLTSAGMTSTTGDFLTVSASEPAWKGPGEALGRQVWRYDMRVSPGVDQAITWTAAVNKPGVHKGKLSVCLGSEVFCDDTEFEISVLEP